MKNIYILLFLLFAGMHGNAQRFNGYANAGVSTSQISGDASGGFNKAGVFAGGGVITSISRNRKTFAGLEIGYIQKGSRKPSDFEKGITSSYRLRLNYLEVPIYIEYAASRKLHGYAGAAMGVLVGSQEENENGELSYGIPFNRFDASIVGGLIYVLNNQWQLNLRGLQSLVPVREFNGLEQDFINRGQYNTVMVFSLMYMFNSSEGG